jgi:hypothetical protein
VATVIEFRSDGLLSVHDPTATKKDEEDDGLAVTASNASSCIAFRMMKRY